MPQEVSMPKEVSKLHAAFRPLRFCDENVPLLQLNEAQLVPVWALNSFPNSKPSIDDELLEKLLFDPTALRKLPPLDAILHHCLDGRYAWRGVQITSACVSCFAAFKQSIPM